MKYFPKKLLDHEIFRSIVSWAPSFFFEKFVKPSSPSSYILNVRSLIRFEQMRKGSVSLKTINTLESFKSYKFIS